jgi:ketosteroid isomerase-like protein
MGLGRFLFSLDEYGGKEMTAEDNLATIRGIYEAFGRGDVETLLAAVANDVD